MSTYLREVFPILEDSVSGFGVAPTRVMVGDSPIGKNGMMVLGFQDVSGNLVLPQLNALGQLPVTSTSVMLPNYLTLQNELPDGAAGSLTTILTLTLVAAKTYTNIAATVACLRSCRAQLQYNNNGTTSVLGDFYVGAGQYTYNFALPNLSLTAGSGTQQLIVQVQNEDKASAIRSTVGAIQVN